MPGESKITTDHSKIKKWAEDRNGKPAIVEGTASGGEGAGLLRINFPGYAEENLKDISWDEFFETFDDKNLAMVYQDDTKVGSKSRFSKFINRNSEEGN